MQITTTKSGFSSTYSVNYEVTIDFDGDHAIDQDEIAMLVVCFLEGWGKIIDQEMPQRKYLERAAKIIYSTPESTSDGRITIKVLGDWIDQNENLMSMFLMFEPVEKVDESNSLFLPLKRDPSHLPILSYKYLGKRMNNQKPVDLKEIMSKSGRFGYAKPKESSSKVNDLFKINENFNLEQKKKNKHSLSVEKVEYPEIQKTINNEKRLSMKMGLQTHLSLPNISSTPQPQSLKVPNCSTLSPISDSHSNTNCRRHEDTESPFNSGSPLKEKPTRNKDILILMEQINREMYDYNSKSQSNGLHNF